MIKILETENIELSNHAPNILAHKGKTLFGNDVIIRFPRDNKDLHSAFLDPVSFNSLS